MAIEKFTQSEPILSVEASVVEPELTIEIWPRECVWWSGTKAQLISEGLIPNDLQWPELFSTQYWSQGDIEFMLVRVRPRGAKGPRRDFYQCDNWALRRAPVGAVGSDDAVRYLELEEEKRYRFMLSPEGKALWDRAFDARTDEKYRAFKALIPGLAPAKCTRKTKTAEGC